MSQRIKQLWVIWLIGSASLAMADNDWWRGMQRWMNVSGETSISASVDSRASADSQEGGKQQLRQSVLRSFDELERDGAFDRDPEIRLELPPAWQAQRRASLDVAVVVDAWEHALNRAAEKAMPRMRQHWLDALQAAHFEFNDRQWDDPSHSFQAQFRTQAESALKQQFVAESRRVLLELDMERFPRQLRQRFPAAQFPDASLSAMARWLSAQSSDAVFEYMADEALRAQLETDSQYYSVLQSGRP